MHRNASVLSGARNFLKDYDEFVEANKAFHLEMVGAKTQNRLVGQESKKPLCVNVNLST